MCQSPLCVQINTGCTVNNSHVTQASCVRWLQTVFTARASPQHQEQLAKEVRRGVLRDDTGMDSWPQMVRGWACKVGSHNRPQHAHNSDHSQIVCGDTQEHSSGVLNSEIQTNAWNSLWNINQTDSTTTTPPTPNPNKYPNHQVGLGGNLYMLSAAHAHKHQAFSSGGSTQP